MGPHMWVVDKRQKKAPLALFRVPGLHPLVNIELSGAYNHSPVDGDHTEGALQRDGDL